jgi:hypothetical protein
MTDKIDVPAVGVQQLEAVLCFLPVFEQPGYTFGEWHAPEGQFPFYSMSPEAGQFVQALYRQQVVFSFDWGGWHEEAMRYVSDPELLETANLLILRKLLTTHVRKDRFAGGHLANMFESGHITRILRRLRTIGEDMEEGRRDCRSLQDTDRSRPPA